MSPASRVSSLLSCHTDYVYTQILHMRESKLYFPQVWLRSLNTMISSSIHFSYSNFLSLPEDDSADEGVNKPEDLSSIPTITWWLMTICNGI